MAKTVRDTLIGDNTPAGLGFKAARKEEETRKATEKMRKKRNRGDYLLGGVGKFHG